MAKIWCRNLKSVLNLDLKSVYQLLSYLCVRLNTLKSPILIFQIKYQIHTSRESGIDRHFKRNVYFAHLADVRISFVEISVPPQKDCITSVYLMLLMKTSNLYSKEMQAMLGQLCGVASWPLIIFKEVSTLIELELWPHVSYLI